MFCPRCSREIEDGSRFCNHCGYEIVPEANSVRESASEEAAAPAEEEPLVSHSLLESQYDLKWYKFLIWFFIWFQAIINASSLFAYLAMLSSGAPAGFSRIGLIVPAAITLLYIVYLIVVRQALARWKAVGPKLYLISVFGPFLTGILTVIAVNAFSGAPVLAIGSADFSRLVVGVALFIFNFIYFRNRAELFTE